MQQKLHRCYSKVFWNFLDINCDDIIFVMAYSSFIKLKWCFKRAMQHVVVLIKLANQVSLVCFHGLYIGLCAPVAITPGVGGNCVRQENMSRGTHFPRKFCPTGQDILSILGLIVRVCF